jgi:predicted DNA-binding transcriptional regulator YafY
MRASRLLTILLLLQTRGRVSARALAESLEVSVRTVFRDVDQLSAAGIPVIADRGRNGGFVLREGWRTPLTGLTEAEAQALFLAGLPGPAAELGLGASLASAHLKVLAALPEGWQANAERVGTRFHLDPVDWFRSVSLPDSLPAVAQAVWNERRLRIRYESWKRVAWHTVDPLGLVLKAGVWYLVARGEHGAATYRVSAIGQLQPLEKKFARPRRFDLAAHWAEATRRFEEGVYRLAATLRVSALGMDRLRTFSPVVAAAAEQSAGAPDARGWRRVVVPIESIDHAAREMLRLGAEGEVLEPAPLRERLRAAATSMQALYAGARPPARPARARGSSAPRSR